eukprot:symbB.v1.2.020184.t1/scaffold1684.1/size105940/7
MTELSSQSTVFAAQASVPEVAVPGTVGPPPGLRATEERAKKVNEYAKTLEKALNNLNHSLPPEGAEKALNLLDMVAKEEATVVPNHVQEQMINQKQIHCR